MLRLIFPILSLALMVVPFERGFGQEQGEEPVIDDYFCPEAEQDLEAGDDYTVNEDLALVLMAGTVHINRTTEGRAFEEAEGCILGTVALEDGDTLVIFKFLDYSQEFSSRYQFILLSESETNHLIALNSFFDIDAVAHELELIPAETRLFHLDEIGEGFVATYALFAGEPSANDLVGFVMSILGGEVEPAVRVEFSEDESTMFIREDLLEEEQPAEEEN